MSLLPPLFLFWMPFGSSLDRLQDEQAPSNKVPFSILKVNSRRGTYWEVEYLVGIIDGDAQEDEATTAVFGMIEEKDEEPRDLPNI